MNIELKEGERIDNIGFGRLSLIQKPSEFCYGIDAVLLADYVGQLKKDFKVVDLGTGTGIIPLILSHKTEASELWGVEIQKESYERANRTIAMNKLTERIYLVHCDVKDVVKHFGTGKFDVVVTNPPYNVKKGSLANENVAKTIARHETTATLDNFIEAASTLLRSRGDFYLIHRPSRLVDIFYLARRYHLEPKEIRFVAPNREKKPNLVLVHCVKGGRPELNFADNLYVYNSEGGYTEEINAIYER